MTLSKKDLLSLKLFCPGNGVAAVVTGLDDSAWLVFALGCIQKVDAIIIHDVNSTSFDVQNYRDMLVEGETIVLRAKAL